MYRNWRRRFKKNLAIAMKKAGYNSTKLAKKLGVCKSNVSFYLSGRAVPKLSTLVAMCKLLDTSIDDMIK